MRPTEPRGSAARWAAAAAARPAASARARVRRRALGLAMAAVAAVRRTAAWCKRGGGCSSSPCCGTTARTA
eukprot:2602165-Prymnesium_polylepis.1